MQTRKSATATQMSAVLPLVLALAAVLQAGNAFAADPVGTVTNLSGALLVRRADGKVMVLSQKSSVEQGDSLVSEKNTYARIKFVDNSEITLSPNTQLKIDNFSFDAAKPEKDNAVFSLIRGGLRSITGLLGKRSHDNFSLTTPTATVGIRGTTFVVEYEPPTDAQLAAYRAASMAALDISQLSNSGPSATRTDTPSQFLPEVVFKPVQLAQNTVPPALTGARAPGLYVQVLDGAIHVTNPAGSQNFTAGQFGFTPSFKTPPVVLPANPGMQFTPPPSFSSTTGAQGGTSSSKPGTVDCVVR